VVPTPELSHQALRYPSAELARHYRANGWWTDDTLSEMAFSGVEKASATKLRIRSRVHPYVGTIGAVGDMGRRLAGRLRRWGIEEGDVVAFQIPNWAEAVACVYGLLSLGVVVVPIAHIYGTKEVGHILRESRARALVTADRFGRQDYLANLAACLSELPELERVIVVAAEGGDVPMPGRAFTSWSEALDEGDPLDRPARVDPDSPAIVGYTSGTTAAPKGVVHTHRSFLADVRSWADFAATDRAPASAVVPTGHLTGAPVGHITGLTSVLRPLYAGTRLDLIDAWDPAVVLAAMAQDGVATGGGAPYFLTSLLDHPDFDPQVHPPYLVRLIMGAAPVPVELAERASRLGIRIVRAYGSTEHPSTTASQFSDPVEKRTLTDGRVLPGSEIRLLDADGGPVPAGQPGEIHSRGPELFLGYVDTTLTRSAIDADGWYDTGDIGVLDEDGYLTITDRKKDIIIRGGENISAAEVEGLLLGLPGVAEVAVVATPDPRFGEQATAVVRLLPEAPTFGLDSLSSHLQQSGLARQKWPERLVFVDEFPRTASGKIQKHVLRSALRSGDDRVVTFEAGG